MHIRTILLFLILLAGCSGQTSELPQSYASGNVYSVVIAHLAGKEKTDARFIGADVWISPKFGKGDSMFYSWGNGIQIDDDLVDSLKTASQTTSPFPANETFGPRGNVKKIESFHDLYYYGENMGDVDAKCLIEFWRPGFSADGKRCVIRFYYGPSPHGAVGTYVLKRGDKGWEIVDSTISFYA